MNALRMNRLIAADATILLSDVTEVVGPELIALRSTIRKRLGLDRSADGLALVLALRDRRIPLPGFNAESERFRLSDCLRTAGIMPQRKVYLNWDRLAEIDSVDMSLLERHFEHFWYPKADDIDIFDASCDWMLSVDCDGYPWVVKFGHMDDETARN